MLRHVVAHVVEIIFQGVECSSDMVAQNMVKIRESALTLSLIPATYRDTL